jgi:hypothetical protein
MKLPRTWLARRKTLWLAWTLPVALTPASAAAQRYSAADPWVLKLDASAGNATNATFLPGGPADWLGRVGASLAYNHRGSKGDFAVSAYGGYTRYLRTTELNRPDYSATLTAGRTLSQRASFRVTETFTESYANQIRNLTDVGILLPTAKTRYNNAFGELTYRASARTRVVATVSHNWAQFDTEGLTDGWTLSSSVSLNWSPSTTNGFSFTGSFATNNYTNRKADILTAALGWTRKLGQRSSMTLNGGVTNLSQRDAGGSSRLNPYGTFTLAKAMQRGQLGFTASHTVDQAFGYGSERVSDQATLNLTRTLTRKLSATMNANVGLSQDPYFSDKRFKTILVGVEASYSVRPEIGLAGRYAFRRNDGQGSYPVYSSHLMGLSLSYGKSWR